MKKVGIVGNFSFGKKATGGQVVKTRIFYQELIKKYGESNVPYIDTADWKKNKIELLAKSILFSIKCKNIMILPAHNGIKIFIPMFVILTKIFNKKLHYIVVGAWLADVLKQNKLLLFLTKKVNHVYVQTSTLKRKLNELEINDNVQILLNFKVLTPVKHNELSYTFIKPLKVCTFSNVHKNKGIEDAIEVVSKINKNYDKVILTLDIYGALDTEYEKEFLEKIKEKSNFISYKGLVDYDKTTDVLKEYYLLLFPTKYYTEGLPGTIVDAYFAGIPVLASKWESWEDVIVEGKTGLTFEFNSINDFYIKLEYLIKNEGKITVMKKSCLIEAEKYTSESALKKLLDNLQ